jgi:hypothetical protein
MPGDQGARTPQGKQVPTPWTWRSKHIVVLALLAAIIGAIAGTAVTTAALSERVQVLESLAGIRGTVRTASTPDYNYANPFLDQNLNLDTDQLAAFLADCDKGVNKWRKGQVDYPDDLSFDKGQARAYVVAVDIRDNPLPVEKVIRNANTQSAPTEVQCVLKARLVPVDNSLTVDNTDWALRQFTPTGVLNWSWSTTALAPGSHELQLELQPAVTTQASSSGRMIILAEGNDALNSTYITRVHVNASWVERAGEWWSDNWAIIALVAAAIGAAVVAVVKWGGDLGQAFRDASAKWQGKQSKAKQKED